MSLSDRKQHIFNHFESIAANYLQYRRRFSYYGKDIINYLNFFTTETDSILEIGCGCGETISSLKGKDKTGIDFSPKMIEVAKANYKDVSFFVMDAENITLENKGGRKELRCCHRCRGR